MKPWQVPLAASLLTNFAAAFPLRIAPVLGSLIAADLALPASTVGYFGGLGALGALAGTLSAPILVARLGALRTLQAALLVSAVGALGVLVPYLPLVLLGFFVAGYADGPPGVATGRDLHRLAPSGSRRLLFAVASLGGGVGSMVSALALPAVVERVDWRIGVGFAAAIAALAIVAIQRLLHASRRMPELAPVRSTARGFQFGAGVRALAESRPLRRLAAGGMVLSLSQGAWLTFFVAYLVEAHEVSLQSAAALLAGTQLIVLGARLGLASWADGLGSVRPAFVAVCVLSAMAWSLLAGLGLGTPFSGLLGTAIIAGLSIAAWPGLLSAEMASRAPPATVATALAAAGILNAGAYAGGVAGLAWLAGATGSYAVPFWILALALAANAFNLGTLPHPKAPGGA